MMPMYRASAIHGDMPWRQYGDKGCIMAQVKNRTWETKSGGKKSAWVVEWKEKSVTDGQTKWKSKRKTCASKRDAERLCIQIESAASMGENWTAQRDEDVTTIGTLARAYVTARARGSRAATARSTASYLEKFLTWAGEDRPVSDLSSGLLREYGESMKIKSVARYIAAVEQCWQWGWDYADSYPGVPAPKRITGSGREYRHPAPKRGTEAPTWSQVDAMIDKLRGHASRAPYLRMALIARYTGLRIGQVLHLRWQDFDLTRRSVWLDPDAPGAKGGGDCDVPVAPALASLMAAWMEEDYVTDLSSPMFRRTTTKGDDVGRVRAYRSDDVSGVWGSAWGRAGVPSRLWSPDGEKGTQTKAVRRAWKSQITKADSYELAQIACGQVMPAESGSYVDRMDVYGTRMRTALDTIPPVGGPYPDEKTGTVRHLKAV